ncbi:MAG: mitochondrial fission ELM1 family protein [Rubrimonas sp.]|uniref:mitochondrial fission ELM1 family protein n=1 Tax=Rubrimonas sp. TaxID=2036015 RepID=UPI002FDCB815
METDLAKATRNGDEPVIWAVTDGRAGNSRQALALAAAVARRVGGRAETRTVALRKPFDLAPPALWALGGAREGGWPFSGLEDRGAGLARPWPAMAVGAGRRSAPIVAALRRLGGVRAVQVLAPQMRLSAFDRVVAPFHDGLRGENVTETLGGLNDLDPETLAREAERWRQRLGHLPRPRVAVLVGGPSASAAFGAHAVGALTEGLARLAVDGAGLMITPSRRTPRGVVDRLAEAVTGFGGWVWGGRGENPYPAVLGLAEAIAVTADSVNMASEAASTGKPVLVFAVDRLDAKIARFHDALRAHGASRPFEGALDLWRYPPLRETERVAEQVAGLLAPA